jgi:hypothetical protein
MISLLATVTKAAILSTVTAALSQFKWLWIRDGKSNKALQDLQLFDDASRGPLGALMMLLHKRSLSVHTFLVC